MVLLRAISISGLIVVALGACDVGEVPIGGGGGGGGGPDAPGTTLSFSTTCVDRSAQIGTAHIHATGGTTNAGTACLNAGCHGPAQPGGEWAAAGTVYKQDGTTPNPGAVVRIKNGANTMTAVTDDGGTFHFPAPVTPMTFPTITDVSACPAASKMTAHLVSGNQNCSMAGCHVTGAQGPIRGLN
jgi:hypothetical protein